MLKKLLFTGCLLGILTSLNAQTTETFEGFTDGNTSFTKGSFTTTLIPTVEFKVGIITGYYNEFMDNHTTNPYFTKA
jgi:hypothetical protein